MVKEVVLPPYNGYSILSIKKLMSIGIPIKIYYWEKKGEAQNIMDRMITFVKIDIHIYSLVYA